MIAEVIEVGLDHVVLRVGTGWHNERDFSLPILLSEAPVWANRLRKRVEILFSLLEPEAS